jgi:hypothetical protein
VSGNVSKEPIVCAKCGLECERRSNIQRYCHPCGDAVRLENHRRANQKYEDARPPRLRDRAEANERNRRYHERHPGKARERSAVYNAANRDLINAKARERNCTEKRRAWRLEWERKRREDPAIKLAQRMKTSVGIALRGKKAGQKWERLVGYTAQELRAHLERQFVKGMTWDNIGDWHVDHILPQASFKYETAEDPDFRACWALTNLRPLWAKQNHSKHAKRLHLI